ncbi:MAG: hypothetical protein PGN22_02150 [Agrobacterium cavarae]
MADFLVWPHSLLVPEECRPNVVPFSRSGGRSLGGVEPSVRTDLGYWSVEMSNIAVHSKAQRLTWNAIRQALGGKAGLIAVPAWSFDTAPYVSGDFEPSTTVPHSDDTSFSDGSAYLQGAISAVTVGGAAIGATVITIRVVQADANLVGVRFSYQHALYETGPVISIDGDNWTVPVWPSVRETIPNGSDLEFDMPTCLCRLQDDRGMDGGMNNIQFEQRSLVFIEATDYWNRLALGLI